jgi:hypothetical protein
VRVRPCMRVYSATSQPFNPPISEKLAAHYSVSPAITQGSFGPSQMKMPCLLSPHATHSPLLIQNERERGEREGGRGERGKEGEREGEKG